MTFSIGNIALRNPVALAPMAGVTDLPFRQLCRRLGAGYVVGEMLASDPSLRMTEKSRLRGVHLDEPEPRAIQIVGWDPATLADAARFNVDQGASVIDINMGCPAKKVCRRYAGSALLADEQLVANILEAVVTSVDVPVTLKIRTGVDPEHRNAVRIAGIAENAGVAALAVHGRTRACRYKGVAEYQTIAAVVNAVKIPVFANGDIDSVVRARAVLEQTGAAGVMLGRGAHGRPWLPGQIARSLASVTVGKAEPTPPPLVEQRQIVIGHIRAIHDFYGEIQGVRVARKHIKWYLQRLPGAQLWLRDCLVAVSAERQLELVRDLYARLIDANGSAVETDATGIICYHSGLVPTGPGDQVYPVSEPA